MRAAVTQLAQHQSTWPDQGIRASDCCSSMQMCLGTAFGGGRLENRQACLTGAAGPSKEAASLMVQLTLPFCGHTSCCSRVLAPDRSPMATAWLPTAWGPAAAASPASLAARLARRPRQVNKSAELPCSGPCHCTNKQSYVWASAAAWLATCPGHNVCLAALQSGPVRAEGRSSAAGHIAWQYCARTPQQGFLCNCSCMPVHLVWP